jgi:hypothetical protein
MLLMPQNLRDLLEKVAATVEEEVRAVIAVAAVMIMGEVAAVAVIKAARMAARAEIIIQL